MIMAAGPGGKVAEPEAKNRSNDADEQALHQEDAANLRRLDAEAHHHGNVAGLLHHHHGQRDENVERGDDDDERDDDEGDHLFELEGAEEFAVLLRPVSKREVRPSELGADIPMEKITHINPVMNKLMLRLLRLIIRQIELRIRRLRLKTMRTTFAWVKGVLIFNISPSKSIRAENGGFGYAYAPVEAKISGYDPLSIDLKKKLKFKMTEVNPIHRPIPNIIKINNMFLITVRISNFL